MQKIWSMAAEGVWNMPINELNKLLEQRDQKQRNPLHIAAEAGKLDQVPKELLKSKRMLDQDREGKTVLHYAILNTENNFECIPPELLTEKNLSLKDINNNTIYHLLGYSKDIEKLDKKLLKECHLMQENSVGISPIEYACMGKKVLVKFFKTTIKSFKVPSLLKLREKGKINEEIFLLINKELKTREIANELSKHGKKLEIS